MPETSIKGRKVLAFSRRMGNRPVNINLRFYSGPLEGVEVGLTFRIQLSKEAQARREKWLGLKLSERNKTMPEQLLDEVADLLIDEPTGLEEFPKVEGDGPGNVGHRLRAYYEETTDETAKFFLDQLIEAASNGYWAAITPQPFSPTLSDSSA